MNTHLGEGIPFKEKATIRQVFGIDELVGKEIKTEVDFHITPVNQNKRRSIKGESIQVLDIIRDCGMYLYCQTKDNIQFAILPHDLELFEEI